MRFAAAATIAAASYVAATPVPAGLVTRDGGSSKRGLVYNNGQLTPLFPASVASWGYNWKSTPDGLPSDREYVPMLWNEDTTGWDANVEAAIQLGTKHILAFNEPDQPKEVGGTNMSPQLAASVYQQSINKYQGRVELGAPAVSAGNIAWLQQFADACAGACHVDFIPLHFYNDDPDPHVQFLSLQGWLASTIPQVRSIFGNNALPIWITEFAALPLDNVDLDKASNYMDEAIPFLEQNTDIYRYSYFVTDSLAANGQLNVAGQRYASG